MSALHWICALTLALVCCLSAQPVKRSTEEKDILLGLIEGFKGIAKKHCTNETKPYSPSDMREECVASAVNCTLEGLKEIKYECEITKEKEDDFRVFNDLYTGLEVRKIPPSPNCQCELYPTKRVEEFLNDMEVLVQRL